MVSPRQKRGFDPKRMADLARPLSVVPQIIDAPKESQARGFTEVKIIGVGGGGSNAVNRMVETGVQGVEFIAVNTDAQALQMSGALHKVLIGGRTARGLGAGGDPSQGERAAEISQETLEELLSGADMVFLTAGLGGGTGTGAAPVIARIARQQRALTVGVVTLPFKFEGARRLRMAQQGLEKLKAEVDALIVVPNNRLLEMTDRQVSVVEAFSMADDVLRHGVQGISDLVTMTGLINLDFADVKAVMHNAGTALMAIGEGRGEGRSLAAARAAISSPLLDLSIEGATGVLLNVSGGADMTLWEVTEAAEAVAAAAHPDANILFGAVVHPRMKEEIKVTVIATGLTANVEGRRSSPRAPRPSSGGRPDESGTRRDTPSAEEGRFSQAWREGISQRARSDDFTRERERRPERSPERSIERSPERPPERAWERDRDRERRTDPLRDRGARDEGNDDGDLDLPAYLRRPRR